MTPFKYGDQSGTANSISGLTKVMLRVHNNLMSKVTKDLLIIPNIELAFASHLIIWFFHLRSSGNIIPRSLSEVVYFNSTPFILYFNFTFFDPKYTTIHFDILKSNNHVFDHLQALSNFLVFLSNNCYQWYYLTV